MMRLCPPSVMPRVLRRATSDAGGRSQSWRSTRWPPAGHAFAQWSVTLTLARLAAMQDFAFGESFTVRDVAEPHKLASRPDRDLA